MNGFKKIENGFKKIENDTLNLDLDDNIIYMLNKNKDWETLNHEINTPQNEVISQKLEIISKVYDVLNAKGVINNYSLLEDINRIIEDIENNFDENTKEKYFENLKKMELIKDILVKKRKLLSNDSIYYAMDKWPMYLYGEDNDGFDEVNIIASKINENKLESWGIEFLSYLNKMKENLQKRMNSIEDFKKGKMDDIILHFSNSPKIKQCILDGKAKKIFTPFGITFIIPKKYQDSGKKYLGYYVQGSPFSIAFSGISNNKEETRDTIIHESHHNIFDATTLIGSMNINMDDIKRRLERNISIYKGLKENHMHQFILDGIFKSTSISNTYIKGLKDEILANYDQLIYGKGSTDLDHGITFLKFLRGIKETMKNEINIDGGGDKELTETISKLFIEIKQDIIEFYSKLSFLAFIARNTGKENVELLRQLMYLGDMNDLEMIEEFLQNKIGKEIYNGFKEYYPILTSIKLDNILLGKNFKEYRLIQGMISGENSNFPFLEVFGELKTEYKNRETLENIYQIIEKIINERVFSVDNNVKVFIKKVVSESRKNTKIWKKFKELEDRLNICSLD